MCRYKSEGDPKGRSDCDSLRDENELVHRINEELREEIARLREENRLLIEDRSRFPDKPDGIGRIIAAHNANREAKITDLENRCRDSLSEITRLREERRWVPVGERLPELNEANYFRVNCLVYCKIGRVCEMTYEINTYAKHERNRQPRWKWHGMISMWEVTHWMPLKLGPEGDGNG